MILKNAIIYLENNKTLQGNIIIKDDSIKEITPDLPINIDENVIDCKGMKIIPGFIDQHTHGGYGYRFMNSTRESLLEYLKDLTSEGTTSVYLASVTHKIEKILETFKTNPTISNGEGADFLGYHLEGPFITPEKKGAHNEDYIIDDTYDNLVRLINETSGMRLTTIAPEKVNDDVLSLLNRHNIKLTLGHSAASCEDTIKLYDKGVNCITHLYNAMSGHNHRKPGIVTAALSTDIYAELICDGIHVHKDVVNTTYKIKGSDQIILITDSTSCKGLEDGEYELGPYKIYKNGNKVTLKNGVIAGSALRMIDAFKNILDITGCSIHDAIKMTSTNASKFLGIDNIKGSIKEGKQADLLILDEDLNISKTIVKGNIVYEV